MCDSYSVLVFQDVLGDDLLVCVCSSGDSLAVHAYHFTLGASPPELTGVAVVSGGSRDYVDTYLTQHTTLLRVCGSYPLHITTNGEFSPLCYSNASNPNISSWKGHRHIDPACQILPLYAVLGTSSLQQRLWGEHPQDCLSRAIQGSSCQAQPQWLHHGSHSKKTTHGRHPGELVSTIYQPPTGSLTEVQWGVTGDLCATDCPHRCPGASPLGLQYGRHSIFVEGQHLLTAPRCEGRGHCNGRAVHTFWYRFSMLCPPFVEGSAQCQYTPLHTLHSKLSCDHHLSRHATCPARGGGNRQISHQHSPPPTTGSMAQVLWSFFQVFSTSHSTQESSWCW